METLICNISGKTVRKTLGGRSYLVAPAALIVSGVLNGSHGPILYTEEEYSRNPTAWNHIPIVVNHPYDDNYEPPRPVSARTEKVLNEAGIGFLLNSRSEGKLLSETWFDEIRTRELVPNVANSLDNNEPIELSTGLDMDRVDVAEGSVFNGVEYKQLATNYRPDHLAVLPDGIGACSIKDGCGVLVNKDKEKSGMAKMTDEAKKEIVDNLISNCACQFEEDDREVLNAFNDEKLVGWKERTAKQVVKNAENKKKEEEKVLVANKSKEGFVDDLGNSHTFNDDTKKWETELKESKEDGTVVGNIEVKLVETKVETTEEWIANAPPEIRSSVLHAQKLEQREIGKLVEKLTVNLEGDEKDEVVKVLNEKSLNELETLSKLAPKVEDNQQTHNDYSGMGESHVSNQAFDRDADLLIAPTV